MNPKRCTITARRWQTDQVVVLVAKDWQIVHRVNHSAHLLSRGEGTVLSQKWKRRGPSFHKNGTDRDRPFTKPEKNRPSFQNDYGKEQTVFHKDGKEQTVLSKQRKEGIVLSQKRKRRDRPLKTRERRDRPFKTTEKKGPSSQNDGKEGIVLSQRRKRKDCPFTKMEKKGPSFQNDGKEGIVL